MNPRLPRLVVTLALVSLFACPALAQAQDQNNPDETGHLYLGSGLTLWAVKPRLLTENASVNQFLYSPAGARIAYVTQNKTGDEMDTSLAIVATQSGETKAYVTGTFVTTNQDSQMPAGSLQIDGLSGWSDDSRYIAFSVLRPIGPQGLDSSTLINQIGCVDLVKGAVSYVSFPPEALVAPAADPSAAPANAANTGQGEPGKLEFAAMNQAAWAPGANLVAFVVSADFQGAPPIRSLCVFDPSSQSTRILVSETQFLRLFGWLDNHHLQYRLGKDSFVYNLTDGKSVAMANPASVVRQPTLFQEQPLTSVPAQAKQTLAVSATMQAVTAQTDTYGNATSIWIQRQAGPARRSRLLVDVFRGPPTLGWDPGDQSNAQFAPNAGFDRQGLYQVAYLSQGDLKVCDLSVRQASLMEQALAGEKLPCNQQQMLALQNAKQVGLAILEYTQDEDEHFPKGDGFSDSIAPYLQPDNPIDLPNIAPFHYNEPASLNLADAQTPAETVLGTYDLPCGTVALYMDGHVQTKQKEPFAGG